MFMSPLMSLRRIFCPRCFSWGTGPDCEAHDTRTPAEKWAMKHSKLCSPDELVAAHIIQSIAKDFDDWSMDEDGQRLWPKYSDFKGKWPNTDSYRVDRMLYNRCKRKNVKSIVIFFDHRSDESHRAFTINDTRFDDVVGRRIINAYEELKAKRDEIERAARLALEEQKVLDARWNLAESLLGMKRNEHGALVPEKSPCGGDYPCPGCKTCIG